MPMNDKASDLGVCPECGSRDCDCQHETLEGDELWVWSVCCECGHHFIEVFKRDRKERWDCFR